MPEQLKFGLGPIPDAAVPKAPDKTPPQPWTVKAVKTMTMAQARNVYTGLHPTGFKMEPKTITKCGGCRYYLAGEGECTATARHTAGSTRKVKVTWPGCERYR